MDWSNVTFDELLSSLKEVDWHQAPRPAGEFFGRCTAPPPQPKLSARLKCNLYYYRANYALIMTMALAAALLRRPGGLVGLALAAAAALCLNDTFATSLSDRILRLIRKIHPPLAQRIRAASGGHSGLGAPGRSGSYGVKIVGVNRGLVVAGGLALGALLFWRSRALFTLAWAAGAAIAAVLGHAAARVPNLKTRLASAREEFRAVWRGYQTGGFSHDYTL